MVKHRVIRSRLLFVSVVALAMTAFLAQPSGQRGNPGSRQQQARDAREERKITAHQLERAESRIALALTLVNRLEPQARALGRSPQWRQASLSLLLSQPLETLQRLERESLTPDTLALSIENVAEDPQLLGESDEDLVFMPMIPCRYIDTRNVGGKITGDRQYDLDASGAAHGGDALCDPTSLPHVGNSSDIGALAMNVTIVDPAAAPGFVAAKPHPSSPTSSLVNWYEVGPSVQAANQGIIATFQGAGPELTITSSAAVHVIVDLFGAFVAPEVTPLETISIQTPWSAAPFDVVATCTAGFSIAGGGWSQTAGTDNVYIRQSSRDGTNHGWRCRGTHGGGSSGVCEATCVRVPGRQ